jgi:hypothetical protein
MGNRDGGEEAWRGRREKNERLSPGQPLDRRVRSQDVSNQDAVLMGL